MALNKRALNKCVCDSIPRAGAGRRDDRAGAIAGLQIVSPTSPGKIRSKRPGQSGEARGKGARLNRAKSSDSNHRGFHWKRVAEFGAKAEPNAVLDHGKELPDPRQPCKLICPMNEILLPCRLAVLDHDRFNKWNRSWSLYLCFVA